MKCFSASLAFAVVCTAAHGQTATSAQTTPKPAIAPAAGQSAPAASRTPGAAQTTNPSGRQGAGGRRGRSQSASKGTPAAVGNSRIVVTGQSDHIRSGSDDRPLLPIVTAGNAFGILSGAPIFVTLRHSIDSAHAKNGQNLSATLAKPIAGLPVGTPVELTVVESSPAGQINSYGELSLQVIRIADRAVLSDIVTALGKEGPKELPDAAPGLGTEAVFRAGQTYSLPAA